MTILAPSEIAVDALAPLRGLGVGKDGIYMCWLVCGYDLIIEGKDWERG